MCDCPAHNDLVDCACMCDHTGDRMRQWRKRAVTATRERNEALAKLRGVGQLATALEELAAERRSLLARFMGPTWRGIARMIREAIA